MAFKDFARLIRQQYGGPISEVATDPEIKEARSLLQQLRTNYTIAYRKRKDKWFETHSTEKYFTPTLKELSRECTVNEWLYYFIERVTSRTPEQRYQDEKNPDYGWNHESKVHNIEEECKEGCRFWPEEGRIEDVEILQDYKQFKDYEKVREIWESLH